FLVFGRYLYAYQYAAVVVALVAVVEQTDVPVRVHRTQELHQGARPLWKLEAKQQLVFGQCRAPAHHVAQMRLGHLVTGKVYGREAFLAKTVRELLGFCRRADLQADKDMRIFRIGNPVIELGNCAAAHRLAQSQEAAPLFRQRQREYGFAGFADIGSLGHETQPVKIHVGPAGDRYQRLVLPRVLRGVALGTCQGQRPRGFQHATRVLEDILDAGTDGIRVDQYVIVHILTRQAEGFHAHLLHCGAVGEQADIVQGDAATGLDAAYHGIGIFRLHTDDLDLGTQLLHISGHARNQAAAADGHEDGIDGAGMLAQYLHAYGALPGNDIGIVKRMDKGKLFFLFQDFGVLVRVGEAVAHQHDLAPPSANGIDLDL